MGLRELDFGEEELVGVGTVVVSEERSGDEVLAAKLLKMELGFAVELSGVEEDEDEPRSWSGRGYDEFGDSMAVEMDTPDSEVGLNEFFVDEI